MKNGSLISFFSRRSGVVPRGRHHQQQIEAQRPLARAAPSARRPHGLSGARRRQETHVCSVLTALLGVF